MKYVHYCLLTLICFVVYCFSKTGIIITRGYGAVASILNRGGVIVIANHPNAVQTVVLPVVISSFRWDESPRNPWSIANDRVLGPFQSWLKNPLRLILVSRASDGLVNKSTNRTAYKKFRDVLIKGGIVIIYPEGGRTQKGVTFIRQGPFRVRVCNGSLIELIGRKTTSLPITVVPVWVETTGATMKITFGTPISLQEVVKGDSAEQNDRLAKLLLSTAASG